MPALTEAEARTLLESMTAWNEDPVLTEAEMDALFNGSKRADAYGVAPDAYDAWNASTVYALDAYAVPTVRNGHYYKVTVVGTSGAAEPTWPTTSGATVVDGTVTWTEQGAAAWTNTYDLNAAASKAWRLKAGKAASRFDFTTDGQSFHRKQVREACLAMVKEYAKSVVASVQPLGYLASLNPLSTENEE